MNLYVFLSFFLSFLPIQSLIWGKQKQKQSLRMCKRRETISELHSGYMTYYVDIREGCLSGDFGHFGASTAAKARMASKG
jgi:hypothetical protein